MSPIDVRVWTGSVLSGRGGGWVDGFILGTTRPVDGVNVGAGVFEGRPVPTVTADARPGVTWNASTKAFTVAAGVTVEDALFPGFVNMGAGSRLVNYKVTGPDVAQSVGRALVQGPLSGGTASTVYLDFGTIDPDVPTSYYDGLGPVNMVATRSVVKSTTDGVRAFDYLGANGGRCNLSYIGCLVTDMAQHQPDVAGNRAVTHNDGCQAQGNPNGSATDILFDGTEIDGRYSTTKGYQPADPDNAVALMLTPNVGAIHLTFTRGWLTGGLHTVNCLHASLSSTSSLAITQTRFERPGSSASAPAVAWSVKAGSTLATTNTGNTYLDNGAPVSITYI